MLRLLLIGVALFLVYQLVRSKFLKPSQPSASTDGGHLVQCEACLTWVAEEKVVRREEKSYCGAKCAEAAAKGDEKGKS